MLMYLIVKGHDVYKFPSKISGKRKYTHTPPNNNVEKLMNVGEQCKKFFILFLPFFSNYKITSK